MKLLYYNDSPNVGDQLNEYIWKKEFQLLLEDKREDIDLLAIGSILHKSLCKGNKTIVFGTGARSSDSLPNIDEKWDIRFVRGPNTVYALKKQNINVKYITDPGLLISKYFSVEPTKQNKNKKKTVGIVPYYRSNHEAWAKVAEVAGLVFISPTLDVDTFCKKVKACDLILTEAMHGAIIADSFRIPWISYTSSTNIFENETHNFKWNDWCNSVDIEFDELSYYHFDNLKPKNILQQIKRWLKIRFMSIRILIDVRIKKAKLSSNDMFDQRMKELAHEIKALNDEYK
jgi:succinoglycan biosynthesis protein ExoV